jgi:hypothetical protein
MQGILWQTGPRINREFGVKSRQQGDIPQGSGGVTGGSIMLRLSYSTPMRTGSVCRRAWLAA